MQKIDKVLITVFLSLYLFCGVFVTIIKLNAKVDKMWVNSLDNTFLFWDDEIGVSPYIGDNLDYIHESKTKRAIEGYFRFNNITNKGSINSVYLYLEVKGDDTDDGVDIEITLFNPMELIGTFERVINTTQYAWVKVRIDEGILFNIDTIDELNRTRITVTYVGVRHKDDIWIRKAYIKVDWVVEGVSPVIGNVNLVHGEGFNHSNPHIYLTWSYTGEVDNYEIYHSSDNITYVSLALTPDKHYNHTLLVNGSYHYYKIRSTYFSNSWHNSSFSAINLERVWLNIYPSKTQDMIWWLGAIFIFVPVFLVLAYVLRRK